MRFDWKISELEPVKVKKLEFLRFFLTLQACISVTMHFRMGTIWVQINLQLILRRTKQILSKSVKNSQSCSQKTGKALLQNSAKLVVI